MLMVNLFPSPQQGVKIHNLIKAPENYSYNLERKMSWDANKPATVYVTPELTKDGQPCKAATVILRTKGCHWWWNSGCTFCGYFNDTRDDITCENLIQQWNYSKNKLNDFEDVEMIKVYTSGSLLEDREIPLKFQEFVLTETKNLEKHLVLESRTEQLTSKKLTWAKKYNSDFTVAIGLEAYDDEVLRFHINKGFSLKSWHRAVEQLKKHDLRIKAYLMFKPPFMSEGEALTQCIKWVKAVVSDSDEISINPMNIQKGTIIDRLYRNGDYRPPWLWSLVELIKEVHGFIHLDEMVISRLIVHPTAAGKPRGAHNCGSCDAEVAAAIERYSVSGSLDEFSFLKCDCYNRWKEEIYSDQNLPVPLGVGLNRRSEIRKMFELF
ncbi:MAG: TIGR01210 family radical SAM protein [Euryarchaeota archaeon]|nr:TIGR01210 family radical SAM protein [Euryarchaeota archaeon]